jgi:hypothetical protein
MWDFSVKPSDKIILGELRDAMRSGKRVALYYDEKYVSIPILGDTKNFITKVEVLEN